MAIASCSWDRQPSLASHCLPGTCRLLPHYCWHTACLVLLAYLPPSMVKGDPEAFPQAFQEVPLVFLIWVAVSTASPILPPSSGSRYSIAPLGQYIDWVSGSPVPIGQPCMHTCALAMTLINFPPRILIRDHDTQI